MENIKHCEYAIISERDAILQLTVHETDEQAQAWYASGGRRGRLIVLDLAPDEAAAVGDSVDVDDDGVATLSDEGVAS